MQPKYLASFVCKECKKPIKQSFLASDIEKNEMQESYKEAKNYLRCDECKKWVKWSLGIFSLTKKEGSSDEYIGKKEKSIEEKSVNEIINENLLKE